MHACEKCVRKIPRQRVRGTALFLNNSKNDQNDRIFSFDISLPYVKGRNNLKLCFKQTLYGSTKHPDLENEAPKSRKRSTQISKTRHPNLETCLPFKNTRQSLVKSPVVTQQKPSAITNRMQFKTIQVELRGVANTFPHPE